MPAVTQIGEIRSDSDPNKSYKIYQDNNVPEIYSCNCPSWTKSRHKLKDGHCKHIKQFLATKQPISFNPKRPILNINAIQFDELGRLVDHMDQLTSGC